MRVCESHVDVREVGQALNGKRLMIERGGCEGEVCRARWREYEAVLDDQVLKRTLALYIMPGAPIDLSVVAVQL